MKFKQRKQRAIGKERIIGVNNVKWRCVQVFVSKVIMRGFTEIINAYL